MCILYILYPCHYYTNDFSYYFSYYFSSDYYFFYYVTIIILNMFSTIFDYVRSSHPNLQKLADANSRPMRWAMTVKCPWAPAKLCAQQASSPSQAKSTYVAGRKPLYALLFILFLFFWMSDQDWAAHNLDLRTAGHLTTNLWEVSCHHIKKKALLAGTWAQSMPFSFVLLALRHFATFNNQG